MAIIVPTQRMMTFQRFFGLVSITCSAQSEGYYTLSAYQRKISVKMGIENDMKGAVLWI
jgi:hypothetical protein